MRKFGKFTAVMITSGVVVLAPGAAQAATPVAVASAAAGGVDMTTGEQTVSEQPVAQCRTGERESNKTDGLTVGATKFGKAETLCSKAANGFATAMVRGQRFETKALRAYGGPLLKVRTYSARCDTTKNGASGLVELSDVSGFTVPESIPANHEIVIPGRRDGDKPIAKLVINELVAPTPPDGSLTTNALRIELFPEGGPASGNIVLGTASCDPYGG